MHDWMVLARGPRPEEGHRQIWFQVYSGDDEDEAKRVWENTEDAYGQCDVRLVEVSKLTAMDRLAARVIDDVLEAVERANPKAPRVEQGISLLFGTDYHDTESLVAGIIGDKFKALLAELGLAISCEPDIDPGGSES